MDQKPLIVWNSEQMEAAQDRLAELPAEIKKLELDKASVVKSLTEGINDLKGEQIQLAMQIREQKATRSAKKLQFRGKGRR